MPGDRPDRGEVGREDRADAGADCQRAAAPELPDDRGLLGEQHQPAMDPERGGQRQRDPDRPEVAAGGHRPDHHECRTPGRRRPRRGSRVPRRGGLTVSERAPAGRRRARAPESTSAVRKRSVRTGPPAAGRSARRWAGGASRAAPARATGRTCAAARSPSCAPPCDERHPRRREQQAQPGGQHRHDRDQRDREPGEPPDHQVGLGAPEAAAELGAEPGPEARPGWTADRGARRRRRAGSGPAPPRPRRTRGS